MNIIVYVNTKEQYTQVSYQTWSSETKHALHVPHWTRNPITGCCYIYCLLEAIIADDTVKLQSIMNIYEQQEEIVS